MTRADCKALAAQYGTPLYVFDTAVLRRRVEAARAAFGPRVHLCYSIKANPFVLPAMAALLDHIEVCSPGELTICEKQSLAMEKVVFSGVNKTEADCVRALADGAGVFTAESPLHLAHLQKAAAAAGKTVPVLLRLSSGNQFGMDESTILQLAARRAEWPNLSVSGLHFFSGTQKKKPAQIEKELDALSAFADTLAAAGLPVSTLEYGPGLGIDYFEKDGGEAAELALLAAAAPRVAALAKRFEVTVEMGRWFTARCGSYLTAVADTKTTDGTNYAILDGGIHQLNYYGQTMAMQVPPITHIPLAPAAPTPSAAPVTPAAPAEPEGWTLCGSLCTAADVLVRRAEFTALSQGDLLVFGCCGAYSMTEAPALFLTRPLPAVLLAGETGGFRLLRPHVSPDFLNGGETSVSIRV